MQGGKPFAPVFAGHLFHFRENGIVQVGLEFYREFLHEFYWAIDEENYLVVTDKNDNQIMKMVEFNGNYYDYGSVLEKHEQEFEFPVNKGTLSKHVSKLAEHVTKKYGVTSMYSSRISKEWFSMFEQYGTYLEIGVAYGNYSKVMLENLKPEKLFLVDCWEEMPDSSDFYTQENLDDAYEWVKRKFTYSKEVHIEKMFSNEFMETTNEKFDMVYIDADHTYEGCKRDLELALKVVKEDGFICGHDYVLRDIEYDGKRGVNVKNYGVVEAVDEFCEKHGWTLVAVTMEVPQWNFPSFALRRIKQTYKPNKEWKERKTISLAVN